MIEGATDSRKILKPKGVTAEMRAEALKTIDTFTHQMKEVATAANITFVMAATDEEDITEVYVGNAGIMGMLIKKMMGSTAKIMVRALSNTLADTMGVDKEVKG